jgi:hypothetical protein
MVKYTADFQNGKVFELRKVSGDYFDILGPPEKIPLTMHVDDMKVLGAIIKTHINVQQQGSEPKNPRPKFTIVVEGDGSIRAYRHNKKPSRSVVDATETTDDDLVLNLDEFAAAWDRVASRRIEITNASHSITFKELIKEMGFNVHD